MKERSQDSGERTVKATEGRFATIHLTSKGQVNVYLQAVHFHKSRLPIRWVIRTSSDQLPRSSKAHRYMRDTKLQRCHRVKRNWQVFC